MSILCHIYRINGRAGRAIFPFARTLQKCSQTSELELTLALPNLLAIKYLHLLFKDLISSRKSEKCSATLTLTAPEFKIIPYDCGCMLYIF